MTLQETLTELEALSSEKSRLQNKKRGAVDSLFDARLGNIRKLAMKVKTGDVPAWELWDTGNFNARLLAVLLIQPRSLPREQPNRMASSSNVPQLLAGWLTACVVKNHPDKEALSLNLMQDDDPWAARALEPDIGTHLQ